MGNKIFGCESVFSDYFIIGGFTYDLPLAIHSDLCRCIPKPFTVDTPCALAECVPVYKTLQSFNILWLNILSIPTMIYL